MTRARGRLRRRGAGFTMFELLVTIAVLGLVMELAVVAMAAARSRLRESARAAEARAQMQLARGRLIADIRGAASAAGDARRLVLTRPDASRVTWGAEGGRLVRRADGGSRAYPAPLASLRVTVEGSYVEVGIRLGPGGEGAPGRGVIFAAARTRVQEAAR